MRDCAEGISERERGQQAPSSRGSFWLLTKAIVHSLFFSKSRYSFTRYSPQMVVTLLFLRRWSASAVTRRVSETSVARGRTVISVRDAPLDMLQVLSGA